MYDYQFIFSVDRNDTGLPLKVYFWGKPYQVSYQRQGKALLCERVSAKKLDTCISLSPDAGAFAPIIKKAIHQWFIQWYCKKYTMPGGGVAANYWDVN